MKVTAKLVIDSKTGCLGYYKDGKFVKVITKREYEEMKRLEGVIKND